MMLGSLGISYELCGQQLFPIGTVYDPFVCRGLDALIYDLYNQSKMIVVGTPSGITLSPEGGAHQSTITPSIGIELPNLLFYEPCLRRGGRVDAAGGAAPDRDREHGKSTYLRLTTKPVDQALIEPALQRLGEETLRRQVLAGGYRLVDWRHDAPDLPERYTVQIVAAGAMIPEAVEAAKLLHQEGVAANVHQRDQPRPALPRAGGGPARATCARAPRGADAGHLGELILPGGAARADRDRPGRRVARPGLPGQRLRGAGRRRSAWTSSASPARAPTCTGTTRSTARASSRRRCWPST